MRPFVLSSTLIAVLAACPMLAGAEMITLEPGKYYSWLQLPMNAGITPSLGSESGVVGSTSGTSIDTFRYGGIWFPNRAMVGSPTYYNTQDQRLTGDDYWMVLTLDEARWIDYVGVGWTTGSQTKLDKYYIEAWDVTTEEWITVGESGDDLGYNNSQRPGWRDGNLNNAVKLDLPGQYQTIRVLVKSGDYLSSSNDSNCGGPGIRVIEPMAASTGETIRTIEIETNQINWANAIFGTTATASPAMLALPGGSNHRRGASWLIQGSLIEDEPAARTFGVWGSNTGANSEEHLIHTTPEGVKMWDSSVWVDINLGQVRYIDEVVGVWVVDANRYGTDFRVQYSLDEGVTWCDVTGRDTAQYGGNRATSVMFDGIEAQYWRISEAVWGPGADCGINQILMYGAIPEPATMSLLALGGLALLRRRK